jgi:hypothetical protein
MGYQLILSNTSYNIHSILLIQSVHVSSEHKVYEVNNIAAENWLV